MYLWTRQISLNFENHPCPDLLDRMHLGGGICAARELLFGLSLDDYVSRVL